MKDIKLRFSYLTFIALLILGLPSCTKFLDEKPTASLIVPRSIADLQSLLNDRSDISIKSSAGYSALICDDYFVTDSYLQSNLSNSPGQNYLWTANADPDGVYYYWSNEYKFPIYISNIVLDQLKTIPVAAADSLAVKQLRGSALFYRSFAFWTLAQIYCRPYGPDYYESPGLVLRLTSDAGVTSNERASVKQTYDQIISDLKEASSLLTNLNSSPTQPSQTAAYALLARTYLSMRDYSNAANYSNLALQQRNGLLDYNTVTRNGFITFPTFHTELIYDDQAITTGFTGSGIQCVDTTLYQSYSVDDLRKTLFFNKNSSNSYYCFFGNYNPSTHNNASDGVWDGLATDELYLIRAECSARGDMKDSALSDLNKLLIKRWKKTVPYPVITASTSSDALKVVLAERRKELINRGLRWSDIRRFNLEGSNITLTRISNGVTYTLQPNDLRSVMLIPYQEINASKISQNPR